MELRFHQKLAESSVVNESGDPYSTDFAFDIGYLTKFGKNNKTRFGLSVQNIGPPIDFIDSQQADPAPTNMKFGIYTELFNDGTNKLNFLFDANKLLVGTYPAMDWNGDGIISGSDEEPHNDPWYKGVISAWLDDWYYGGDYDLCEGECPQAATDLDLSLSSNPYGTNLRDNIIGGYEEIQMDIIQNDPLYSYTNNISNGSYSYPFPVDENDADGYCNSELGEDCIDRLITDVNDILTSNQIFEFYQPYVNPVNGFTCGDAMILQTNDNSDQNIVNWDDEIDLCGKDWVVMNVEDEQDYSIYEPNSAYDYNSIVLSGNCFGFDFNNDGECDCVDNDGNGYCDAFEAFDIDSNGDGVADCADSNSDGNCDIDLNGDGLNDCLDSDNDGFCDALQYCDQFHFGDTDGNGYCNNYYLEITDFSHNDQYLIPTFSVNDVLSQNVNYLNGHFFESGNMYDWFEENQLLSTFNGVLQKTEETIYLPNYTGFCEDVFSSYDQTYYSNGYSESSPGHSLCYDQEGDSYFDLSKDIVDGGDGIPDWKQGIYHPNNDFGTLSWIDIPHDGLGDYDRFHPNCNDDLTNNFYCDGDWIGITEETYIQKVDDLTGLPIDTCTSFDSNGNCDFNDPLNSDFSANDWNQDGFVDAADISHIEQMGYVYLTNSLDVDGDGNVDSEAWFLDSDSDGNSNAREAHHDLDVDGSDHDVTGGYEFSNSKYGYYNAYGNYEKGSGDDRSFNDELEEIIYNLGFEWEYTESFIVRLGFIYDLEGGIKSPTFGAGL